MDKFTTLEKLKKALDDLITSPRCVLQVNVLTQDFDTIDGILRGLPSAFQVVSSDRESGKITVRRTDISKQYKDMMIPLVVDLKEEG